MNARKMIFLVLAAVVPLTLAFGAQIVKVPGTGISINLPVGWSAKTPSSGEPLILLSSKPLDRQGFRATIALTAEDLGQKTPEAWLADYKKGLAAKISDFQLTKERERTLGGTPYHAIEFSGMYGKAMVRWLQVIHFQEGKAWIFSANTLERYSHIYMRVFQRTYSSIYFPPPPPDNFAVEAVSETDVALSWAAHPLATAGYEIQRLDDQAGWKTIATLPAGTISYSDTDLNCGTELKYRIRCLNPRGNSNWSKWVTVTLGTCPAATAEQPAGGEVK